LYKIPFTILRYGIPYGPRARPGAVVPIFVKKALQGEPLTIAGDGLQFRKFVYVEDLAEGNVLALKSVAENKIYNLEGSEKVSIRQIAETIQKILGKVEIKFVEGRPGDFSGKEISNRRALEDLGWEPRVSFEEGVRRYIEWYRKQEELREKQWAKVDSELR
jgi:UDP-glucose 4-epimerase